MGVEDNNEVTKGMIQTNDKMVSDSSNVDPFAEEFSSNNKKDVLPLNTSVLQRIRLNISTGLPSSTGRQEAIVCIETERSEDATVTVRQNNGTVLQKTMRQKLANVLQSDSQLSHQKCQNSIQSEHPVIDMSSLCEQWSALDSHFRLLDQKVKKSSKKNCICLDSELWINFNAKMNQMRELLDPLTSINRCTSKRSTQQTLIRNKKLKHFI